MNRKLKSAIHAACQISSITAVLSKLIEDSEQHKFQDKIERSMGQAQEQIDNLYQELHPKLTLSENEFALLDYLVRLSPNGLNDPYDFEIIQNVFDNMSEDELLESCYKLKTCELVTIGEAVGGISFVSLQFSAYWLFDENIVGTNPSDDCITIAKWILENKDGNPKKEFIKENNWPSRRFNPAYSLLLFSIGEISPSGEKGINVSKEIGLNDYLPQIFINSEITVKIRSLIDKYSSC